METERQRWGNSPRGKKFLLTDEMIALRDGLARGLGYVLRERCSFRDESHPGPHFLCWESEKMECPHEGRLAANYHCVYVSPAMPGSEHQGDHYGWPEDAETAAWAIDKGKTRK